MAAASSEVAMGRRMKGPEMFTAPAPPRACPGAARR
jgi:hypothetical protein